MTALAPPNLLEKMSEALTQHANPDDRGHASATLHNVMLPVLDEQEQASFLGVIRRLDTLGDAVVAMVSIDTVPLTSPFSQRQGELYQLVMASRASCWASSNASLCLSSVTHW